MVIRLALAGLLLVTIGTVGNFAAKQLGYVPQRLRSTEYPRRNDYLRREWLRICGPFPSEICASKLL